MIRLKAVKKGMVACDVVHSLPGRLRIHCRALGFLDEYKHEITARLSGDFAIETAVSGPFSETVCITYDSQQSNVVDILELVETTLGEYATTAYKRDREIINSLTVQERRLNEEPISEMATRIAVTAASLLFNFLRPAPVATTLLGKFLNLNALTALSLSKPIFASGFESMRRTGRPNADTLSATAILASILTGKSSSSLTIILLADIAELLTAYTMERTRNTIADMLSIGEQHAWKVESDGKQHKVYIDEIAPKDVVAVHTGSKIPVDGTVTDGEATVDEASLTGEYMPAVKRAEETVYAGSTVKTGTLFIRADRVGDDRAISRIVHMVEEAQDRKAPIQSFADQFSAQFIPVNFALALIVYAITKSPTRALNMLIIDYSCGVRLSTATAFAAAVCRAATQGVLVKGGAFLEALSETNTLILDKTGTITEGRPRVTSVHTAVPDMEAQELVELAAACEETANHPIALAVVNKARQMGWRIPQYTGAKVHLGLGVEATVGRRKIRVGNASYMKASKVPVTVPDHTLEMMVKRGESVIYVSRGRELLGVLGVQDSLREDMKRTLNKLRRQGFDEIMLLTGDVEEQANVVASKMLLDSYKAEAMPDDKADKVLTLQARGSKVVMVGDGVNDAPALAYADVGIALGRGSTEISIETADIAINSDNPLLLPGVIGLGQQTMGIVKQNFAASIGVNSLGIILASLGVLPVFWGAVLHNATTIAVVANSARLLVSDFERDA